MTEGTYDTAQICRNGHVITESLNDFPNHGKKFCGNCGAETITSCTNCGQPIRGHLRGVVVMAFDIPAPKYCDGCGNPYPWTESAISAAAEMAHELGLTEEDSATLNASIPDLITESPKTEIAVARYKRIIGKTGVEGARAMQRLLEGIVAETVKRILWP